MTAQASPVEIPNRAPSTRNKIGLVLAVLFGLSDLITPFTPAGATDQGPGAPMPVLVADAVLGLVTLGAVVFAWRSASRVAARIVAGTRILSALTALPAFFVSGVPAPVVAIVAATVVLTVVCVVLVLAPPRERTA
ncbi:hypothetical protein [Dactylosporangium sp. CA-139066]|uniref:hypothetical protein n=1 Tax=Dactylosporangium sp. CA-139066 TaxID=3239930 RepID=UPI003D8B8ADA